MLYLILPLHFFFIYCFKLTYYHYSDSYNKKHSLLYIIVPMLLPYL